MPICRTCSEGRRRQEGPQGAGGGQEPMAPAIAGRSRRTGFVSSGAGVAVAWLALSSPLAPPARREAPPLPFPPPAAIERRTAFLTEEQLARAKALAGPDVEVTSRVVTYYVGLGCDS